MHDSIDVFERSTLAETVLSAGYTLQRQWSRFWPLPRGRGLMARLTKQIVRQPLPIWVRIEPGVVLRLSATDMISRMIMETGEWEPATWAAMREDLHPGATFVDVGAHIGICALRAKAIVGPNGRVVAVEPHPDMQRALRENIKASGADVIVAPFACADNEMTLALYTGSQSNSGSSSLSKANACTWGAMGAVHQVLAKTLDSILQQAGIDRVDVLKIDVEGAELAVLQGARGTLARNRPVLMLELDEILLREMGASIEAVHKLLEPYGYRRCGSKYDANNYKFIVG
jgi:FkbM family methyltransferase